MKQTQHPGDLEIDRQTDPGTKAIVVFSMIKCTNIPRESKSCFKLHRGNQRTRGKHGRGGWEATDNQLKRLVREGAVHRNCHGGKRRGGEGDVGVFAPEGPCGHVKC